MDNHPLIWTLGSQDEAFASIHRGGQSLNRLAQSRCGERRRSGEAAVRLHRAIAVAGAGQPERSFEDFERAVVLFAEISARPNLARAHHAYGQALEAAGRTTDAAAHLREAERLFADLGIEPDPVAA